MSTSVCEDSERLRNTPSKDRAGKPSAKGQSLFEKKWLGGFRKKVSFVGMGRSSEA